MINSRPTVSVVMPAYNEESAIASAIAEVQEWVLDRVDESELIVVDDGSRDSTGAILDRLAAEDSRIRVIHRPNGGHGPALRTGLEAADGAYLFLIDSDRQIPINSFEPLWDAVASGNAAAFGVRVHREDPQLRLWLTRIVRHSLLLLFRVRIADANVPFKLLERRLWEDARSSIREHTLAPSLFLAVFAKRRGYRIAEIPVPHRERQTGVVSIRRWRLVKFCGRGFGQLLGFRWRMNS